MPDSLPRFEPLVSIITVTYNSSLYVRDAIESVLSQRYSNLEHIIGDDCSTDDTWDIICGFNDPRILRYRNERNIGEYANRNKAIELAKGKYLLFIDGDDILLAHGLGFYVDMMERFPEAGFAIQKGYLNNMVFPALISSEDIIQNHYFGAEDLLSSSFASNFFKLDVLREAGMLSTKYKGGDNEIRVRLALKFPVLLIAGWVSWPRETPGSASSDISLNRSITEVYQYTNELITNNNDLQPDLKREILDTVKSKIAKYILKSLIGARLAEIKELSELTGMGLKEIYRYSKLRIKQDSLLMNYTPVSPYKKDYLR